MKLQIRDNVEKKKILIHRQIESMDLVDKNMSVQLIVRYEKHFLLTQLLFYLDLFLCSVMNENERLFYEVRSEEENV